MAETTGPGFFRPVITISIVGILATLLIAGGGISSFFVSIPWYIWTFGLALLVGWLVL